MFYVRLRQARCFFSICWRSSNFVRQWKGRSLPDSSHPDSNSYGQTTCCFFRCSLPYFHFRKNSVVIVSSRGIKNWFLLWDVGFHDEWPIIPWLNGIMWDYVGFSHIFPYFMVVFGSSVAATVALQQRCRWALPPRISTGWKHETSRCPKTHAWRRGRCGQFGRLKRGNAHPVNPVVPVVEILWWILVNSGGLRWLFRWERIDDDFLMNIHWHWSNMMLQYH